MSNNIIDGAALFEARRQQKPKSILTKLKGTTRVPRPDRLVLATNLGKLASELDQAKPGRPAKLWFNKSWDGDRWQKRKRYICFPGETPPDPDDDGAFIASGSDWTKLIEAAATDRFPGEGDTIERERERVYREILRGTTYLPRSESLPVTDGTARNLLFSLAQKILERLAQNSDLERLWDILKDTPFAPLPWVERNADELLEQASLKAQNVISIHHPCIDELYRFALVPGPLIWSYPLLGLGLLGHQQEDTEIFVLPRSLWSEAVAFRDDKLQDKKDHQPVDVARELLSSWLTAKGLPTSQSELDDLNLPYDDTAGYGWAPYSYEIPERVVLAVMPKPDGSPGLWLYSCGREIYTSAYPIPDKIDCLDIRAKEHWSSNPDLDFKVISSEDMGYHLMIHLGFDTKNAMAEEFSPTGPIPGLLRADFAAKWQEDDYPGVEGWLDDIDNAELQDFLFRNPVKTRFCPSISVDADTLSPCGKGTIAASLFGNVACPSEERILTQLCDQAEIIAASGLAYHQALIAHHQRLIENL